MSVGKLSQELCESFYGVQLDCENKLGIFPFTCPPRQAIHSLIITSYVNIISDTQAVRVQVYKKL